MLKGKKLLLGENMKCSLKYFSKLKLTETKKGGNSVKIKILEFYLKMCTFSEETEPCYNNGTMNNFLKRYLDVIHQKKKALLLQVINNT